MMLPYPRRSLPGSVVERDLQDSMSRMFPELLRFSSSSRMLDKVPDELKNSHRPLVRSVVPVGPNAASSALRAESSLWDGWVDTGCSDGVRAAGVEYDSDDDRMDLTAMGL
jgi:hypothetical protein